MGVIFTTPKTDVKTYHDLHALDIDKNDISFSSLKGKVILVSNVASKWGLTALNYREFKALLDKYQDRGLLIQAFPCNQFGFQEPGSNASIKSFAAEKGFQGLMMDKVKVNGSSSSPVFDFLKVASGDTSLIGWNFAKFLVKRDGTVHGRYGPKTSPMSLESEIKMLLEEWNNVASLWLVQLHLSYLVLWRLQLCGLPDKIDWKLQDSFNMQLDVVMDSLVTGNMDWRGEWLSVRVGMYITKACSFESLRSSNRAYVYLSIAFKDNIKVKMYK